MIAIRRIKLRFWLAVYFLSAMSLTLLIVPVTAQGEMRKSAWPIVIAIIFWLFALIGYGTVISANKRRKQFLFKRFGRDIQLNFPPGCFGFFANPIAKIADISLIALLLSIGIIVHTPLKGTYLIVVLLSLFTWAVNMHCLFNSRTFRITKYKIKRGSKS